MKPLKILVVIGSTRQGRYGEKPAKWIQSELSTRANVEVELVDLRDFALPFFDDARSPARGDGKYANEAVQKWADKVASADAFVFTAAEYNHGYTAVLKNAFDVLYPEWAKKPVGFVGYGGVGGARAIEQLRQVVIELQMAPVQAGVHIPGDIFMATVRLPTPIDPALFEPVKPKATLMIDQLLWWGRALKAAREA
ncbi:MAG: NAD(P)H-dependent oxidoreductase [Deltaproteobacteria bacterium]|nr:NAD(P)H-dependent oxidoreductase [Deltaproteobacteria bacterium]